MMDEATTERLRATGDSRPMADLPPVPDVGAFAEFDGIERADYFEDCDRFLWWGPYELWHVRELAPGEPCPRLRWRVYARDEMGAPRKLVDVICGDARPSGWYAMANLTMPSVESHREEVGIGYVAARALPTREMACARLGKARRIVTHAARHIDALPREEGRLDGWRHLLRCTRDDTGEVLAEREVSPWGFYRFALVAGADPELIATASRPETWRDGVAFEGYEDVIFAAYDTQDEGVFDFCDDAATAMGDLDTRCTFTLEAARA